MLKDFRDRRGDALAGKPTFLLRHGKRATCAFSLTALTVGSALLLAGLRDTPLLAVGTLPFLAALALLLLRSLPGTALALAALTTAVEAASSRGLDNVFVPVTAATFLAVTH